MTYIKKAGLVILILLNAMVLLGQIWPEGMPSFAKTVNIVFLVCSLLFFIYHLTRKKQ
ncbi:MAG: hypothetical protein IPM77_03835 [Crocinitomicaceae bacterium]|nr:hypothetical protein [Crocinitomicaceae bacterium]